MSGDLLTLRLVAEKAGIGYESAKQRIRRRQIEPATKYGKNHMFTEDVVPLVNKAGWQEWLNGQHDNNKGESCK